MELFVAVVKDRHTDLEVEVFTDQGKAIAWAEKQAKDNSQDGTIELDLNPMMVREGYVYHATYSPEGDSVWVQKKTLDSEA